MVEDLTKELTIRFWSANPSYVKVALSVIDNSDFIRANLIAEFAEAVADELCRTFKVEDGWEVDNSISAALRAGEYGKKYTGIHLRRRTWRSDCFVVIHAEAAMAGDLLYGVWGKGACEGDLGQKLHTALEGVSLGKYDPPYCAWWRVPPDLDGVPVNDWRKARAIVAMSERKSDFIRHLVDLFDAVTAAVRPILDAP
jgi:hypothetical protein